MHKAKNAFLRGRAARPSSDGSPTELNSTSKSASAQAARKALFDDESPSMSASQGAAGSGGGVLSTLLKLYEQPQSNFSSQATLVPSRPPSPDLVAANDVLGTADPLPAGGTHLAPARPDTPPSFSANTRNRSNPQLSALFREAAGKWQDLRDDRPSAARSQGGVFGALQASTFNLTGAATPAGSTIAPAPKRPGFRIESAALMLITSCSTDDEPSRHSSPEVPTKRTLSRPGTPGSGTATPTSPSPGRATPPMQRRGGSALNLSALGKIPGELARTSEKLAKENLHPKNYYRESAVLKAAKSSGSAPSSPKNEYADEKTGKAIRRKKDKRRQEEIFITMHVAAILQRQDFVLRLARALMMFG